MSNIFKKLTRWNQNFRSSPCGPIHCCSRWMWHSTTTVCGHMSACIVRLKLCVFLCACTCMPLLPCVSVGHCLLKDESCGVMWEAERSQSVLEETKPSWWYSTLIHVNYTSMVQYQAGLAQSGAGLNLPPNHPSSLKQHSSEFKPTSLSHNATKMHKHRPCMQAG